jgi:viroplasmin and RNaseH domain-containing protein
MGGGKKSKSSKKYYAVASGRKPGVYESWDECKAQVYSYPGASHKVRGKFPFFRAFPPSSENL